MANIIREDDLFYQSGSSNKVYKLKMIKHLDNTFSVYAVFGKRWANYLRRSDKCSRVSLYNANKVYSNMLNEKFRKGYQPD